MNLNPDIAATKINLATVKNIFSHRPNLTFALVYFDSVGFFEGPFKKAMKIQHSQK